MTDYENEDNEYGDRKSKSQMKRDMLELQELGEKLAGLPLDRIMKLEILPELKEAVLEMKKLTAKEAKRRQMQYIGALMREADPEPIKEAIADIEAGSYQSAKIFKKAESWRDRLCAGDDALESEIIESYPGMDVQQFRQHARNAKKEFEKQSGKKAFRVLFKFIKGVIEGSQDTADTTDQPEDL